MKTRVLEVRSPADAMAGFVGAWKAGKPEKSVRISFETQKLLKALCGGIVFPFEAVKVEFLLEAA